jgi:hypothetical protein
VIIDEDGGWAAPILAEHLAHAGIGVTIVGPAASFAPNVTVYSRVAIESRLGALGVTVTPLRRVVRAERDALVLADTLTGRPHRLEGVTAVVRSRPREACAAVLDELRQVGFAGHVHLVGDAYAPRTALESVYEGHLAGLAIGVETSQRLSALPTYRPPLVLGGGEIADGGLAAPEGVS